MEKVHFCVTPDIAEFVWLLRMLVKKEAVTSSSSEQTQFVKRTLQRIGEHIQLLQGTNNFADVLM